MRILVPVDGSSASAAALDFIAERAASLEPRPELRLLNVQLPIPPRAARAAGRELVRSYHLAEAARVLQPATQRLRAAGFSPKARHAVGHPATVVGRAAANGHPDLVVMGSRGQTALAGLLFGSVTQAVLAASTVPLLVVNEPLRRHAQSLRVVIAVDGSRHALAATRYALSQRALFGPQPVFTLVHVAAPAEAAEAIDAATRSALALFTKAGIEVQVVRLEGRNPGDAIAAHLAGNPADLVVMGSHGRSAFKALVLGSVATRVAARCRLPLLLVRPRSRPSQAGLGSEAAAGNRARARRAEETAV